MTSNQEYEVGELKRRLIYIRQEVARIEDLFQAFKEENPDRYPAFCMVMDHSIHEIREGCTL